VARPMASQVKVSPRRLKEFLEAEIAYLSRSGYSQITVEKILEHASPRKVARLIHKELPARFATRIMQIESTTPQWEQIPGMKEVHRMLHTSFINLRLVEFSDDNLDPFTDVVKDLRSRHKSIVQLLSEVGHGLKARGIMDDSRIDAWLGKFMNSRAGTEMLTKHYMEMLTNKDEANIGIADTRCNPAHVVTEAIEHVKRHCVGANDIEFKLSVEHPDIEFSFIASYLFYIVEELLKNSICATLMRSRRDAQPPKPIRIIVCADPDRVGIQVSDIAGGVPFEHSERIWSYMFSTTPDDLRSGRNVQAAPVPALGLSSPARAGGPISGPGMGLPLCRLYTRYLGGSLDLMSMPGVGTDAYLFLTRIDAGSEFRTSMTSTSSVGYGI